jgi:hypothetical protein
LKRIVQPKFGSWNRQDTKNAKRNIVLELIGYSPDRGAAWLSNPMKILAFLAVELLFSGSAKRR